MTSAAPPASAERPEGAVPKATGSRAERRTARIEHTLQTAIELVRQHGLEGLTMQRLARELGQAVGAVYRYFPSKADLLAAAQERVLAGLGVRLAVAARAAATEAASAPPRAAALAPLLASVDAYSQFADDDPAGFHLLAAMIVYSRELLPEAQAAGPRVVISGLLDAISQGLEGAVAAGSLQPGDARRRSLSLWAAVHGALTFRKLARHEAALGDDGFVPGLVDDLLRAWGADPETLTAARRLEATA